MPKVTFLPVNMVCDVQPGESILDAAINHGVPIQHACGGFCACTTCHVYVESGAENISGIDSDEMERLEIVDARQANSRLACQSKPKADITVTIVNLE